MIAHLRSLVLRCDLKSGNLDQQITDNVKQNYRLLEAADLSISYFNYVL